MDRHNDAVSAIAASVRGFYDRKEGFRIYHGSTNSTRSLSFQRDRIVDTSSLTNIFKIDREKRTALVEPNVSIEQLVKATLENGLVPPVAMEFPGITVGGGFSGPSFESSSFKHGFFSDTIIWIEMVLANGEVVTASRGTGERLDLLDGAAGSFGTLGVTTLLEVQLIEAKPYVELTYIPINNVPDALQKLQLGIADPSNDYVEGILFGLDKGIIITGRLTDRIPKGTKPQRFTRRRDPWFYLHTESKLSSSEPTTEAIPIFDYIFRYDRGAFWMGKYMFQYFLTPFNRFTRFLLDPAMRTKVGYNFLHESGFHERYFIQDMAVPQSTAKEFIEYIDEKLGFDPLWLCPLRNGPGKLSLHPNIPSTALSKDMFLNVGIWGPGPQPHDAFVAVNRDFERKLRELEGLKWMYAQAYYTEEEFWGIYDRKWYDALRRKYDATFTLSVYDKVKVDLGAQRRAVSWAFNVWPLPGLYGVTKATLGSNYLLGSRGQVRMTLALLVGLVVALVALFPQQRA